MSLISSYRKTFFFPIHPRQVSGGQLRPPYFMKYFFPLDFTPLESNSVVTGSIHLVDSDKQNLDIQLIFSDHSLQKGATHWTPNLKIRRTRKDGTDLLIKKKLFICINIGPNTFISNEFHLSSNQNQIENDLEESRDLIIISKKSKVEKQQPTQPRINLQSLLWKIEKNVLESFSGVTHQNFVHPYGIDLIFMREEGNLFHLLTSTLLNRTESHLLERNQLFEYDKKRDLLYVYINRCKLTLEELKFLYELNPYIPDENWIIIFLTHINLNRPSKFRNLSLKAFSSLEIPKEIDNVTVTNDVDDWNIIVV